MIVVSNGDVGSLGTSFKVIAILHSRVMLMDEGSFRRKAQTTTDDMEHELLARPSNFLLEANDEMRQIHFVVLVIYCV